VGHSAGEERAGDLVDEDIDVRYLVRDRDTKYVTDFDEVFWSEGAQIRAPPDPECERLRRVFRENRQI